MSELQQYPILFPNLPLEIILYFQVESKDGHIVHKTLIKFLDYYQKKYNPSLFPQPRVVSRMCDVLVDLGNLSLLERNGMDGTFNKYLSLITNERLNNDPIFQKTVNTMLSYEIYGFKLIYEDFKKYVLPVEHVNRCGDSALGTCFLYRNGIATAKHCVENARKLSILGISADQLKYAKYEIHTNKYIDLVFIRFVEPLNDNFLFPADAEILDEVMTLGYPKIAGYHNFLTAENATVSSRFTTSVGQVVSNAEDIWARERLFLITAKIQGGNSGGPVVRKDGGIIGVAANLPFGDGKYDELGYGTVIPISFLNSIIDNQDTDLLSTSQIEFVQFPTN